MSAFGFLRNQAWRNQAWRNPPWSGRRNLALSIDGVSEAARAAGADGGLDESQARLWAFLCEASRRTLRRLLADGGDPMMDWGLLKYARRVDDAKLVVLFWWTLLYQMVLFRNRGLDGCGDAEGATDAAFGAARRFLETEFARLGADSDPPGPWAKDWRRQFALESAMALYNHVYALLGVPGDLTKRINHVSHFTTATERAYDDMVRERAGGGGTARESGTAKPQR